jgi:hypothetical protein
MKEVTEMNTTAVAIRSRQKSLKASELIIFRKAGPVVLP